MAKITNWHFMFNLSSRQYQKQRWLFLTAVDMLESCYTMDSHTKLSPLMSASSMAASQSSRYLLRRVLLLRP